MLNNKNIFFIKPQVIITSLCIFALFTPFYSVADSIQSDLLKMKSNVKEKTYKTKRKVKYEICKAADGSEIKCTTKRAGQAIEDASK